MKEDCIFCKIANGKIEAEVVYEDDAVIAFKDINPQAPIHYVFIPREHIPSMNDLSGDHAALVGDMMLKIKDVAARDNIAEDGYRVVFNCNRNGGQEVFHLHAHLLGGRPFAWPAG